MINMQIWNQFAFILLIDMGHSHLNLPALWVVLPGGASKNFLPFVDIVRLNS